MISSDTFIHPIMGYRHSREVYAKVDLSAGTLKSAGIKDEIDLAAHLATQHQISKARYLWGGYLERRSLYQSDLFLGGAEEIRDIHLGIDIWGIVYEVIHAPLDGLIHSFAYNDQHLDYGYTLILQHDIDGQHFYTLYGHLGDTYYHTWKVGASISAGVAIGDLGPKETNGGWLPHLHFQCILDMESREGDFPGVCSASDKAHYQSICPDPTFLIAPINKAPSS